MSSLLKRHSTLLAFTLSIAASTAFVACGDDDGDGGTTTPEGGASTGGTSGSGGSKASGGTSASGGSKASGGTSGAGGGPTTGGTSSEGGDEPGSNADASSDASDDV